MKTEINKELELARELVENTGVNVFLTGKAGTGKTTFLRNLRKSTRKRMVVLAPTGIAAINAEGMTIHSFFQLDFAPFYPGMRPKEEKRGYQFSRQKLRVIRSLDVLVIDEISMVRADLLDAVDNALRRLRQPHQPFGGVQLLLIGDLQQLPPVVKEDEWQMLSQYYRSPYFFDSQALAQTNYVTVELNRVYRQDEGEFLDILNRIRANTADAAVLERLNSRCHPDFTPPAGERYIRLTTHNYRADAINDRCMARLKTTPYTFNAIVKGTFPESSFPAPQYLTLKEGAQVMFVKNDPSGQHSYYNGLLGEVIELSNEKVKVRTEDSGRIISVSPVDWENVKYEVNAKSGVIEENTMGVFSQLPLRPAWAITIHKSQGLTFDRAMIDAADSFTHGQAYVALSRCRTLEGLILETPLRLTSLICDPLVGAFMHIQAERKPSPDDVEKITKAYNVTLLRELFGFNRLSLAFSDLRRCVDEAFASLFPNVCAEYARTYGKYHIEVCTVAEKFARQFENLVMSSDYKPEDNDKLQERIKAGAKYFSEKLTGVAELVGLTPTEHDSTLILKRLRERIATFVETLGLQRGLLRNFSEAPFSTTDYLRRKAEIYLDIEKGNAAASAGTRKQGTGKSDKYATYGDNPHLYRALLGWRRGKAAEESVPAFRILPNKTLLAVANANPADLETLRTVKGIGSVVWHRYGEEIIDTLKSAAKG